MPTTIVKKSGSADLTERQAAVLCDFAERMSPTQATKRLHLRNGTIQGAIERGEIEPYRFPGSERVYVTPAMLADWLDGHCRGREVVA